MQIPRFAASDLVYSLFFRLFFSLSFCPFIRPEEPNFTTLGLAFHQTQDQLKLGVKNRFI